MPRRTSENREESIQLTSAQDAYWVRSFENYANGGSSENQAVKEADRDLIAKWPELAQYKHWRDPAPSGQ